MNNKRWLLELEILWMMLWAAFLRTLHRFAHHLGGEENREGKYRRLGGREGRRGRGRGK